MMFNTLILAAEKSSLNVTGESTVRIIPEGEVSLRPLPMHLIQTFCRIIPISQIIVRSRIDPDDTS